MKRLTKVFFKFFLAFSVPIGIYWGIYFFTKGSVPTTNRIYFFSDAYYDLSFSITRWWDLFAGPLLYCTIIVSTKTLDRLQDFRKIETDIGFIFGLLFLISFSFSIFFGFQMSISIATYSSVTVALFVFLSIESLFLILLTIFRKEFFKDCLVFLSKIFKGFSGWLLE